jgi:hypothetical protein
MAFRKLLAIPTLLAGLVVLGSSPARASMELEISSGGTTLPTIGETSPGIIDLSSGVSLDSGQVTIGMVMASSNSASNGPGVVSQMGVGSVFVSNSSGIVETIVLTLSDVGFSPDSASRPLNIFNSASVNFSTLLGPNSSDSVTFQTYAYDGTGYFQTSGNGVVSTASVVLPTMANGSTTTAAFTPANSQFSLTDILTIKLDPGASIFMTSGNSLVHAPEPGALALVGSGAIALVFGRRFRRRRAAV